MPVQLTSNDILRREMHEFLAGLCTVEMATVNRDGIPEASYAPFITDAGGNYHVFISGLARHTRDLIDNGRVSLLFIEDESTARNLFARRRINCVCTSSFIPRDDPEWEVQLARFTKQYGKFIDTLRGLSDFRLFRLTPVSGSYVRGMGQAFRFQGPRFDAIRHVRGEQNDAT